MAKSKFIVPEGDRKEFDLLVQRANRRIQSSLRYIQKQEIESEGAQRALMGRYVAQSEWHTTKTVFSRSKTFASESDYKQFLRHITQWGGAENERSPEKVKESYYKAIIQALNTTALDNDGILTKSGKLPGNLAKEIKEMSLDQLANWFSGGDPTEDIENMRWGSDDYIGVDRGEFVDITRAHINRLKETYPAKATARKAPTKRKGGKRKRRK